MKLNNKGFAISTIMYMILILGVVLIVLTLSILSGRKLVLDKVKKETNIVVYTVHSKSYKEVMETLQSEVLTYKNNNNIASNRIKVSDINSSVDINILKGYELLDKYLIINGNNVSLEN